MRLSQYVLMVMDAVMTWSIKSPAANSSYPKSTLNFSLMGANLEPEPAPALLRWETGFYMEIAAQCLGHSQGLLEGMKAILASPFGLQGCFRRQEVSSGPLFPSPVAINQHTEGWTGLKLNCHWKLFHWHLSTYCSSLSGFSAFPCSPHIFPLLLKTSSTGCGSSCEGLCKQQHCQVSCTSAQPVTALASAPCHLSSPDVDSCSRAKCYLCRPATVLIQP